MAAATDGIKLVIRTANNKHADFNLELAPTSTVYELKQKITLNHPTKPVPKDQRLIYSGKLLEDGSLLNQIFVKSTSGSSFMVHLVLDSDKNATSPSPPKVQPSPKVTEQVPTPEISQPVSPPRSSTYEQYLAELNAYQQQLQNFLMNPSAIPPGTNPESQVYLQYCYTHYQMYQNLLTHQRTVAAPFTTSFQQSPTTTQAASNTVPPPPPPQAAPAANNNEFEQENDLLGVLNMLVELFVLCSIIYFYSTLSRFLVVFLIFALLYLHCRGYLSIQRRRRPQVPPAPVNPEQPAGNDAAEDEIEGEPAANEAANLNDAPPQHAPPPPAAVPPLVDNQISTTRVLFTAVSAFFSSLIPERPQRA